MTAFRTGPLPEMSCKELVEVLTAYLEGSMTPVDRERFELHLGECEYCVNYLDEFRRTVETVGKLEEESLSPEVRDELLTAFRGWKESS